MTDDLVRARRSTPAKLRPVDGEFAAASAQNEVVILLDEAATVSGMTQQEVANRLGVTEGRVSQVLHSEGNLRITTLARYLAAMGFTVRIEADPVDRSILSLGRRYRQRRPRRSQRSTGRSVVQVHARSFTGDDGAPVRQVLLTSPGASVCDRADVPFQNMGSVDAATSSVVVRETTLRVEPATRAELEQ